MSANRSSAKALKITFSVMGIAILFFITAVVLLMTLVNPNNFKTQISSFVQQKTGRAFVISGDIKWSFFPWLGLRVNQMALGNAPGFGQQAFAEVGETDVSIRLLPLFTGKVEMGTVTLKDATFNLVKNKQGQTNWSDLIAANSKTKSTPSTTSSNNTQQNTPTTHADTKIPALSISDIDIKNATINWKNQQVGQTITVNHLDLNSHKIALGETFPVKLSFHIQSNQPVVYSNINFNSQVNLNPDQQTYTFKQMDLTGNFSGLNSIERKIPFQFKGDVATDLKKQTLQANNLAIKLDNLKAQGNVSGKNILQTPLFQGNINVPAFNLRQLLTDLGQKVQTQDNTAMQTAGLKAQMQFSPKFIKLSQVQAVLDDTTLTGRFNFANFASKYFDFDLNVNQIDVSRYLSATSSGSAKSESANPNQQVNSLQANATAAANGNQAATPLPVNLLRQLNGVGTLKIGKLTVAKITTTDILMQLEANRGLIKISPMTANLYQGQSQGGIILDARSSTPSLSANETMTNVNVGQMLNDVSSTSKIRLSGNGNLNLNLRAQGKTSTAMMQTLNGNIRFAVNNGAIQNLNIGQQITSAIAHVLKTNTSTTNNTDQTDFSSLTGTVQIVNGIANNNDLLLKSSALQATGSGSANLINQTIDYSIKATALDTTFGRDIIDLQQKIGGSVPIRITGSLSDPKIQPDYAALAQGALQGQVGQHLEQQIEKHLGKDINVNDAINAVKGLLGS